MKVAVIGATGAVGQVMLSVLAERKFPVTTLIPFASERSRGKALHWNGSDWTCQVLENGCFDGVDYAFFDASDPVSKQWVPAAARAGAWVLDNSAAFRLDADIPLVVPEINGALVKERVSAARKPTSLDLSQSEAWRIRVFAGPNCSTVQLVMVLKPLHDQFTLKRVVVSTYQSVSGAGSEALRALRDETRALLDQKQPDAPRVLAHRIAFNCIPQIGSATDDGATSEEQKIIAESRKILDLPKLRITATAVRVPTQIGHGESANIEFERPCTVAEARGALEAFPSILLQDDLGKKIYPMGASGASTGVRDAGHADFVGVGRVRLDSSVDSGLNLWLVSDNLRKGAALNAIQTAEVILSAR